MRSLSIDKILLEVVLESYKRSFAVQSDYARAQAEYIAMAASLGLISTKVHNNVYSRDWRPTVKGLMLLESDGVPVSNEEREGAPIEHS